MPSVTVEEFEQRKQAVKKVLPRFYGVIFEEAVKKNPEKYARVKNKTALYNVLNEESRNIDALECLEDLFLPKEKIDEQKEPNAVTNQ